MRCRAFFAVCDKCVIICKEEGLDYLCLLFQNNHLRDIKRTAFQTVIDVGFVFGIEVCSVAFEIYSLILFFVTKPFHAIIDKDAL